MSKGSYVCQRAAHAIIAELGPFRISSDALQAINMFIDEFLALLLISASSLDLVRLKAAVTHLLPDSLGKSALVEAEVELRQAIESNQHDLVMYEKMRSLNHGGFFPLNQVVPMVQEACFHYCALAFEKLTDKKIEHYDSQQNSMVIASIVIVYLTTIIEHMAEFILNSVAVAADQSDTEHIRVKEVLFTLLGDPQINVLFRRMTLKDKLEKRASMYYTASLPSPVPSPVLLRNKRHSTYDSSSNEDKSLDSRIMTSNSSMRSSESLHDRPVSVLSDGTVKSTGSKSRFKIFGKEKRNSISHYFTKRPKTPSITSPISPSFSDHSDFDELLRSGSTKRVSLTPTRLKSIEVSSSPPDELSLDLERMSLDKPTRDSSLPISPPPRRRRISRDHYVNTKQANAIETTHSPPLTPASSVASRPSQRSRRSFLEDKQEEEPIRFHRSNSSRLYKRRGVPPLENVMLDTKPTRPPRIERPSSMVLKRASMGSRPPSFHESALEIMAASDTNKLWEDLRTQYEANHKLMPIKDEEPLKLSPVDKHADMIYVIPSSSTRPAQRKIRSMDRGCQTDPLEDQDEEWFIEEEDLIDSTDEEKVVAGWLLDA
ncbi:uncharacterized protein B0P05DRAFT_558914 [Gilbertella persicaria]|uniref:uncharacterized protein n=1 Tax=Gilbertella persicaria TaxID=101096 RepID=UPI002220365D|nr:uncharacterized protein B0P05DRAFT_558914 [Gilbertella persicaria]KAI8059056.1 hypothetical protein B0P05DRAFT_558914 [Gilbertella persicaria]